MILRSVELSELNIQLKKNELAVDVETGWNLCGTGGNMKTYRMFMQISEEALIK